MCIRDRNVSWVCVSWFHILPTSLCYFCTEIRRRLPFRSQSHTFRSNFFWHRKQKRATCKRISIFQPNSFGKFANIGIHFVKWSNKIDSSKDKKSYTYLISSSWTSYDSTLRRNTWTSPFLKIRKCFIVKFCDRDFMCIKWFNRLLEKQLLSTLAKDLNYNFIKTCRFAKPLNNRPN